MGEDPRAAAAAAFQEKFKAIQRDWLALLPARLQEARDRLQACRDHPGDPTPLEELHRLLHTLAGSAGTFGLASLGQVARQAENELAPLMARTDRTAADFDAAARSIDGLAAAAAAQG